MGPSSINLSNSILRPSKLVATTTTINSIYCFPLLIQHRFPNIYSLGGPWAMSQGRFTKAGSFSFRPQRTSTGVCGLVTQRSTNTFCRFVCKMYIPFIIFQGSLWLRFSSGSFHVGHIIQVPFIAPTQWSPRTNDASLTDKWISWFNFRKEAKFIMPPFSKCNPGFSLVIIIDVISIPWRQKNSVLSRRDPSSLPPPPPIPPNSAPFHFPDRKWLYLWLKERL